MNPPTPHSCWARRFVAGTMLGVLVMLPACSEPDPGLQEQLARTQAELQKANAQLQEKTSELERIKSSQPAGLNAPASSAASASRSEVEARGEAAARNLAAQFRSMQPELASVECMLGPVRSSGAPLLFISEVVVTLRRTDGSTYRQSHLVVADSAGNWVMPAASDLVASVQTSGSNPSATPARRGASPPPNAAPGPPGAVKSGSFDWSGDAPAPPTPAPQSRDPQRSSAAPRPPSGTGNVAPSIRPTPIMPVVDDKKIDFK